MLRTLAILSVAFKSHFLYLPSSGNNIVYKIFIAMSKDLYIEIGAHFCIESVENLVANRRNRFINSYSETDNFIYVKRCADRFVCLSVFYIYCVRLISVC